MRIRQAIGDFAGMTHYHPGQVPTAQVIRRLPDLGIRLDEIRAVHGVPAVAAQSIVDSLTSLPHRPPPRGEPEAQIRVFP